jgi:hypothetical protein
MLRYFGLHQRILSKCFIHSSVCIIYHGVPNASSEAASPVMRGADALARLSKNLGNEQSRSSYEATKFAKGG